MRVLILRVNIPMRKCLWGVLIATVGLALNVPAQPAFDAIDEPPHLYFQRRPQDKFSQMRDAIEAGRIPLDRSSEKAFLISLLKALDVPASSQLLVFSTTSLQLSLISRANPRALYFNEEIYLGYVPGGRIELASLDPTLGAIFHIFDVPIDGASLIVERSGRCMNCHAGEDTGYVPGLVVKSVMPGPNGGSLQTYRAAQTGHQIPFAERFGGWHVTGEHSITNHLGNLTGELAAGNLTKFPNLPGQYFRFENYPIATSDILPHLLHEHQVGFVNRVVEAAYRARTVLHVSGGKLTAEQTKELETQTGIITRYLLFADEVPLPAGGIRGETAFLRDFQSNRRATADGLALKDFDLRTRLFRHRCSYMIYSSVFTGLPSELKQRVYAKLDAALDSQSDNPESAHLPPAERRAIRTILKATLPDLPKDW